MDLGLKNKVALITGGSEGIGFAAAMRLSQEGAQVAIAARREDRLQEAAAQIRAATGGEVLAVATDVSDADQCVGLVERVAGHFGRLDILVNNAGTSAAAPFSQVADDAWAADLDLKLYAAIRCTRAALPYMKAAGGGAIVNVVAVVGKTPSASSLPTAVSRAAGMALTKAMSKDFGPLGIRVNALCIGLIRSKQIEDKYWKKSFAHLTWEEFSREKGKDVPLGRVGEAEEAGNAIAFLVSSAASYISGVALNVDGGRGAVM